MILAGDIGGTKCTLALFEEDGARLKPIHRSTQPTHDFPSIEALLDDFRAHALQNGFSVHAGTLTAAAFGVAGAIVGGHTVSSNLPWPVDSNAVANSIGLTPER